MIKKKNPNKALMILIIKFSNVLTNHLCLSNRYVQFVFYISFYTLQRRACWAKPLFGLTIYLYGGSGYPTLGCSRLRDPMRSLSFLSLHFLLLRPSLSLSFLPPKLHPPSIHSFLLFIASRSWGDHHYLFN